MGQRFEQIQTYGRQLRETDYGDGYDVGAVVTYDGHDDASLPKFAVVVARDGDSIETIHLATQRELSGGGPCGYIRPFGSVFVPEGTLGCRSEVEADGGYRIRNMPVEPWDGEGRWFDLR